MLVYNFSFHHIVSQCLTNFSTQFPSCHCGGKHLSLSINVHAPLRFGAKLLLGGGVLIHGQMRYVRSVLSSPGRDSLLMKPGAVCRPHFAGKQVCSAWKEKIFKPSSSHFIQLPFPGETVCKRVFVPSACICISCCCTGVTAWCQKG